MNIGGTGEIGVESLDFRSEVMQLALVEPNSKSTVPRSRLDVHISFQPPLLSRSVRNLDSYVVGAAFADEDSTGSVQLMLSI